MADRFRHIYDRQIDFLTNRDHEGLIDTNYTPDAELLNITLDHPIVGAEALKAHFAEYIAHLGYLKVLSTDRYMESSDGFFFEATVETAAGVARVYDVMTMQGERIARHYSGLLSFTPKG
jgi:hypothetical protein